MPHYWTNRVSIDTEQPLIQVSGSGQIIVDNGSTTVKVGLDGITVALNNYSTCINMNESMDSVEMDTSSMTSSNDDGDEGCDWTIDEDNDVDSSEQSSEEERSPQAMEPDDLSEMPLYTYQPRRVKGQIIKEGCSICVEEIYSGQTVRLLPCTHMFHGQCIDPWLIKQATCPLCKLDILNAQTSEYY